MIVSTTAGPILVVIALALRMEYLRFRSKSQADTDLSHVTPSNFCTRHIVSEKTQIIGRGVLHVRGKLRIEYREMNFSTRRIRTLCYLRWTDPAIHVMH